MEASHPTTAGIRSRLCWSSHRDVGDVDPIVSVGDGIMRGNAQGTSYAMERSACARCEWQGVGNFN